MAACFDSSSSCSTVLITSSWRSAGTVVFSAACNKTPDTSIGIAKANMRIMLTSGEVRTWAHVEAHVEIDTARPLIRFHKPQERSTLYNQEFGYGRYPAWSDHCEHRSWQGQDHGRHGDRLAGGWTGNAGAHA